MSTTAKSQPVLFRTGRPIYMVSFAIIAAIVCLTAMATPVMAQNHTIVVVAPHPDDEGLCCAGELQRSAAKVIP